VAGLGVESGSSGSGVELENAKDHAVSETRRLDPR
jgi:hypothetical protein